jgi:hypothetical protein
MLNNWVRVTSELGRVWKEDLWSNIRSLSQHLPGWNEQNHDHPCSLSPGRNSNQAPSKALFLESASLFCSLDLQGEKGRCVCYAVLSNEYKTLHKISCIRQPVTTGEIKYLLKYFICRGYWFKTKAAHLCTWTEIEIKLKTITVCITYDIYVYVLHFKLICWCSLIT